MDWTGGVAQAVEHMLCQREALNLNPSPIKKKKLKYNLKKKKERNTARVQKTPTNLQRKKNL
jgi:hypothetical protein